MFFFYASSWLAERAADWLIVQGGYYMAAIAMRSSPIIPFKRDHQESPPSSIPPYHPLPLPSLPFHLSTPFFSVPFLPAPLFTHTVQCRVNRAPPALSEQMGAAKDSRLVSPSLFLTLFALTPFPFLSRSPFGPRVDFQQRSDFSHFCLCEEWGVEFVGKNK